MDEAVHKPQDYQAFIDLTSEALDRVSGMRLLGWCLMPNHWHFVLMARGGSRLIRVHAMAEQYARSTLAAALAQRRAGTRLPRPIQKLFVENDEHYLTSLRYIEANPLRAKVVRSAQDWLWSSLTTTTAPSGRLLLSDGPLDQPRNWLVKVNEPLDDSVLADIRTSAIRGRPYGDERWVAKIAARFGLQFTLRDRGRPRKKPMDNHPCVR